MRPARKLVTGICTLALTAATLVTATYAWFPINSEALVDGFDLTVNGGQGFFVSVDGVNYNKKLTTLQMEKAIVVGHNPSKYMFYDGDVYTIKQVEAKDDEGNIIYQTDEKGNVIMKDQAGNILYKRVDASTQAVYYETKGTENTVKYETEADIASLVPLPEYVNTHDQKISTEAIEKELAQEIQLSPITSTDGRSFKDLYNSSASVTSGKFVEFSVYFRAVSQLAQDDLKYEIYLNGENKTSDEGEDISPTQITSKTTTVALSTKMKGRFYNGTSKELLEKQKGETITVYSSNAVRLSITDENNLEVDQSGSSTYAADATKIFELNDYYNNAYNFGSYASDYSSTTYKNYTDTFDEEIYNEYGAEVNAMYNYYNQLRRTSENYLKDYLLPYSSLPSTIKDLTTDANKPITTVVSGEEGKKITFRIWLEGWDADCFDGLSDAIDVKLSFTSKRID